jgi:uncharacterized protein YkwD
MSFIMKNLLFVIFSLFCVHVLGQDTTMLEKTIFDRINTHRVKIGKSELTYNNDMVVSCRKHSRYMGKTDNLVHVKNLGEASAEIIQMTYIMDMTNSEVANEVLQNFINSPSHKKIVESNYNRCSVGIFIDVDQSLWVTIRFF